MDDRTLLDPLPDLRGGRFETILDINPLDLVA